MKIFYITREFCTQGGTERIVSDKMNWLTEHGHEVCIVTINQNSRVFPFMLSERIKHYDLGVNIRGQAERGFLKKLFYFFRNKICIKLRLKKLLVNYAPDVCISLCTLELSSLASINDGSLHVAEIHSSRLESNYLGLSKFGLRYWLNKYYKYRSPFLLKHFDRFVVLSREEALAWRLPNITIIPNFTSVRNNQLADLKNKSVIVVARLVKVKNIRKLLSMWKNIVDVLPDWKLDIYGDGEEREDLENYAYELNISRSVTFHGATANVYRAYQNSSLLFLTSRFECFPLVPIEAQRFGIPCVVFRCNEIISEIVQDGKSGYVIENGNESDFIKKAILLMSDYEKRREFGLYGAESSKKFSSSQVMPMWVDLFQKLLKKS